MDPWPAAVLLGVDCARRGGRHGGDAGTASRARVGVAAIAATGVCAAGADWLEHVCAAPAYQSASAG